ncbi:MAG: RCC1 domain-containing protein [Limisphaerales bacterium]
MKPKRLLIAGAAAALFLSCYFLLRGPEGRLKLPAGHHAPMIGLGASHGLVLAPDGSLWSWGGQDTGWPVLGLGKMNLTANLVRIGSETDWAYVSAGEDHNLVLKSDGTIWAWGANYRGQLGDGKWGTKLTNGLPNLQERPVHTVAGSDWVKVEAGFVASYGLKRDGSLWAWGLNDFGQLGIGSWTDSPKPVQVGTATNWVKIRAGLVSVAGIQSDGSLWIWGGSPKLGNTAPRSPQNLLVPTRITADTNWVDVAVGCNIWLAVKADGTLWAWGRNAIMLTGAAHDVREIPTQIGHDTDWQSVCSSKGSPGHLLRKRDGTFWRIINPWENNPMPVKDRVALPPNIVAWGAGGGAVAAITQDGEVWTCGAILGQHGLKYRFLQNVEELCWRLGWKVHWQFDRPRIVREQPWQLRNVDPRD